MTTQCRYCPLQRKDAFIPMSKEELSFMEKFKSGELTVEPGTPILLEGSNAPQLYTALTGMGIRDKTLENGNRQVISFVFPGDFIGLQAGIMGEMGHSVEARTHMRLCVFNRSEFWNFFKSHPERAFDITWLAAIEEHFMGEVLGLSVVHTNKTLGALKERQLLSWSDRVLQINNLAALAKVGMTSLEGRQKRPLL